MRSEVRTGTYGRRIARGLLGGILAAAAICFAAATAATFLDRSWWVFDLFTHFRVQYVAAAGLVLFVAVPLGYRRSAIAVAVCMLPHLWVIGDLFNVSATRPAEASAAPTLRIASANVLWGNRQRAGLVDWIRSDPVDVLVLQEASYRWQPQLEQLRDLFPYVADDIGITGDRPRELHVFSRYPITSTAMRWPFGDRSPYLVVKLDVAGQTVTVVDAHAPTPQRDWLSAYRKVYFDELARWIEAQRGPVIVAGDFNVTPWSGHYRDFIANSNLRNASSGRGWFPTWPTWLPLAGLPIDHVLVSKDIAVRAVARGPDIGSDHRPILVDLTLPQGK